MVDDNGKIFFWIVIIRKNENVLCVIVEKFNGDLDSLLVRICDYGRNSIYVVIIYNFFE